MSDGPRVLQKRLYTATASATNGRNGRIKSDDGILDLAVVPPKEMGGSGAPGTNPEQLFAAGYSACFGSAFAHVARLQKVATGPVDDHCARHARPDGGRGVGIAVELVAEAPELARAEGEALLRAAHEICPYSNATRGNIVVDLRLA